MTDAAGLTSCDRYRTDLVADLRLRLEDSERRLAQMDSEQRDTSAALREELALRGSQVADLTAQLLQAKRTIVEQEVSSSEHTSNSVLVLY